MKDGGWAFPQSQETNVGQRGMTLRDWFAGQALAGFCVLAPGMKIDIRKCVLDAYNLADAMLTERERKER